VCLWEPAAWPATQQPVRRRLHRCSIRWHAKQLARQLRHHHLLAHSACWLLCTAGCPACDALPVQLYVHINVTDICKRFVPQENQGLGIQALCRTGAERGHQGSTRLHALWVPVRRECQAALPGQAGQRSATRPSAENVWKSSVCDSCSLSRHRRNGRNAAAVRSKKHVYPHSGLRA